MNYNDVVNRIQEIVEDHNMLVDFGYGQVSDIKTRAESGGDANDADYPYLFLNPTQHQRTQQQITYNFNMIVMDMAREEEGDVYQNFLNIQSDCIQYIDDVVARLYYHYTDKPEVSMELNYTPFYERFQDNLAGATATLSIVVPNSINECIAPFTSKVLLIDVNTNVEESGDQFHQALRVGPADFVNYPEYDEQSNEFAPWFWKQGAYDYSNRIAPLVLNDFESDEQPYYTFVTREVRIPAGVTGTFRFEYDLELTNIQGIEFPEDLFRIQVVINGSETFDDPIPALPLNGDIVYYKRQFTYVATEQTEDVRILFRYRDEGTPAPSGPLVGYRGNFKLYLEE